MPSSGWISTGITTLNCAAVVFASTVAHPGEPPPAFVAATVAAVAATALVAGARRALARGYTR
jgi:hypothetical protein